MGEVSTVIDKPSLVDLAGSSIIPVLFIQYNAMPSRKGTIQRMRGIAALQPTEHLMKGLVCSTTVAYHFSADFAQGKCFAFMAGYVAVKEEVDGIDIALPISMEFPVQDGVQYATLPAMEEVYTLAGVGRFPVVRMNVQSLRNFDGFVDDAVDLSLPSIEQEVARNNAFSFLERLQTKREPLLREGRYRAVTESPLEECMLMKGDFLFQVTYCKPEYRGVAEEIKNV